MDRTVKYLKIALFILAIFYAFKCAKIGHDFEVFLYAGGKLVNGQNIYYPPFVQGLQYYYSPLFALLLAPFSGLPVIIPQILWIFLSYFLLYRVWVLSTEYFDAAYLTPKQRLIWLTTAFILSIRFILIDIGFIQMTAFLLYCTLQSIKFISQKRIITGAALLAFAINIKLLPLPFVCYLLYRRQFKACALTCLFYLFFLFLPAVYLGWSRNLSLVRDWFGIINPSNREWTIEAEDGPSSLVALIPVYITKTTGVLSFKRNFVNLSIGQVTVILNIVRLFFLLLTLLFLRMPPFKKLANKLRRFWEMCYLFIVIPLLFPHQQQYAFVYIIPAFIYLSWFFLTNWKTISNRLGFVGWAALAIVGVNFTPLIGRDIITKHVVEVLLYLRILPMAVILLIPILWLCRPRNELTPSE